jgi:hypothetical protein
VSTILISLKIQVDRDGRIHSLTDDTATWKFIPPIPAVDLAKKYNDLLTKTWKGLKSLTIQVDRDGRIH